MEILNKKKKDNVVVDTLSHKDEDSTMWSTLVVVPDWLDEIRTEYAKDPNSYSIIENIDQHCNFEWKNNILWYKGKIYQSPSSKFKIKAQKESYNSPAVGHVGFFKTYYNTCQSFYWKGMSKEIQKYVA